MLVRSFPLPRRGAVRLLAVLVVFATITTLRLGWSITEADDALAEQTIYRYFTRSDDFLKRFRPPSEDVQRQWRSLEKSSEPREPKTSQLEPPRREPSLASGDRTARHVGFSSLPDETARPNTKLIRHAPGWTMFENLYMSNGTLYIVTSEPLEWPALRYMISVPMIALNNPESIRAREPTPNLLSFISPREAESRWGDRVWEVKDWTFMITDPPQFLQHYYHFVAETFLGLWRMYSSMDPSIDAQGSTNLPMPGRIIAPYCSEEEWQDFEVAPFNQWFLRGIFPSLGLESARDWKARVSMTSSGGASKMKAFRFSNIILSDRSAAFRGEECPGKTDRIVSEAYLATKGLSSRWWWEPIRRSVLRYSGVQKDIMDRSAIWDGKWRGGLDVEGGEEDLEAVELAVRNIPIVVSYIVRTNRRMLRPEDHQSLLVSLTDLCTSKGWTFNVVHAEHMTREEQIQMAANTTIMLGVHGNGLTHLVWMPSTPLSTVIEMFYPGGFAMDYEWTARALGHRHYGIQNDT
ncbi:hypothetical protein FRB96_001470 [Tulasnella sp. 330]|nr:hypothetical protein FRB96_001470 [Tulasnella sp. 330]KAG8886659.1 hypothetical protein FRB97_000079 [Tulasnella sp. 331]KAG8890647.1 hypothetical protein FRB98_006150 [Tulasnella sp. 332]